MPVGVSDSPGLPPVPVSPTAWVDVGSRSRRHCRRAGFSTFWSCVSRSSPPLTCREEEGGAFVEEMVRTEVVSEGLSHARTLVLVFSFFSF